MKKGTFRRVRLAGLLLVAASSLTASASASTGLSGVNALRAAPFVPASTAPAASQTGRCGHTKHSGRTCTKRALAGLTDVVVDEPLVFADDNPCTGEPVEFTGRAHHVMHFSVDGSGGIHIDDNMDLHGSGISATLVSYTMSDRQFLSINLPGPPQTAEETVNFSERITRSGESWLMPDDYTAQFFIHFTINADGVPTAQTTKGPGSECK